MSEESPFERQWPTVTVTSPSVRIRLDLDYDGTGFHGWAKQGTSDLRTVQKVLEDNLTLVLREPIELTVAGRTDAGVHAAGQVAHFDVNPGALEQRSIDGDPTKLVRRLARLLLVHPVRVLRLFVASIWEYLRDHFKQIFLRQHISALHDLL